MEGPVVHTADAVIDNGAFGTRTIRFETGRLARQAAGSVVAYLDDETMLLSATTAGKHPKEHLDFFPLTVDVEERMYAAGRIPGSFFRREGRPVRGRDPHLPADRPAAAPVVRQGPAQRGPGRRHGHGAGPRAPVRRAWRSTPRRCPPSCRPAVLRPDRRRPGRPDRRPVGRVPDPQQLEEATFDMVVAGRVADDGDVAIMMVEAEATEHTWHLVTDGAAGADRGGRRRRASRRPSRSSRCCARRRPSSPRRPPSRPREFPIFLDYQDDVYDAVDRAPSPTSWPRR